MTRRALTVLVTGIGGAGHGEQILKALRLAETEYRIVGTDISSEHRNFELVDHAYVVPRASDPRWLEAILNLCSKHDVRAVFHGNEAELAAMSRNRDAFHARGIFLPINPPEVIQTAMDKLKTAEFLRQHGFRHPRFTRIRSLDDLRDVRWLPAVLKPSTNSGGSRDVLLAQTASDLEAFAIHLLHAYAEFIAQEYVGTPDDEYTVGVLTSLDGELINSIAVKRDILNSLSNLLRVPNRTPRADLGPVLALSNGISQGAIGRFPEVTEQCEAIALRLGAKGPINIQCRFVDGFVYVFEINPRFSGTTSLRAMVGFNEPDLLIRKHVFGESIRQHFDYGEGVIRRSLVEHLLRPMQVANAVQA